MADTVEETFESEVRRKTVRTSYKIEEVSTNRKIHAQSELDAAYKQKHGPHTLDVSIGLMLNHIHISLLWTVHGKSFKMELQNILSVFNKNT